MRRIVALLCLLLGTAPLWADDLRVPSGNEIPVEAFGPAAAETLLLWLPSEFGLQQRERRAAAALGELGFAVRVADLHTGYFLAAGRSSLESVPPEDLADLIDTLLAESGARRAVLLATSRGAAPLLRAARLWQRDHRGSDALLGALLVNPNLHARTPEPGEPSAWLPIAGASNLPVYVFQPQLSAKYWTTGELAERLGRGGSSVFVQTLPGISDDFLQRFGATEAEERAALHFPQRLVRAIRLLGAYAGARAPVERLAGDGTRADWRNSAGLKPFKGNPEPPPLAFPTLDGSERRLADLHGRVVLVNFWATWCPPCVKEIPSLGRLHQRLEPRGFSVLAVSVGEPEALVRRFMADHPAQFPVLLDSDGASVERWRIAAFPTNFLLDAQGRIRYAYFGALEWDSPETVAVIESLLAEAEAQGADGTRQ
jgi:thiol-disulfide isomerase/thioredoxin